MAKRDSFEIKNFLLAGAVGLTVLNAVTVNLGGMMALIEAIAR